MDLRSFGPMDLYSGPYGGSMSVGGYIDPIWEGPRAREAVLGSGYGVHMAHRVPIRPNRM